MLSKISGEKPPPAAPTRRRTTRYVSYLDARRQTRASHPAAARNVWDGSDGGACVGGVTRHVYGYLEDFLFPQERVRSQVKSLSGGERNRLLLARLLTRPANVLILDEPTNDLDIETLELLEQQLLEFPGTILVVSH